MTPARGLIQTMKGWLGKPIATPETDPERYFGTLMTLPNPDPILRQMGKAEQVYASIMADPHVLGEIRSVRGSFRSHNYRVVTGDENDAKADAARDLCEQWMEKNPPNQINDWLEVMWQMCASIFTGYRPHELVWGYQDGSFLPSEVIDRPTRRIKFDIYGKPMLVSRGSGFDGLPIEPYQMVISRHMPSSTNPYGVALLSSCFWMWTFKTGGWRFFMKYCERHGLPWPFAKYPAGTTEADQDKLAEALASMIEAGYVMAPDGTSLELLTATGGGTNLPQERLINLCNREMSKAITGQAMVGEQMEVGSRAAAETAQSRQNSIHDSDRDIAAQSMSQIFKWITLFNFGEGVAAPILEFYQEDQGTKERAETYQLAANMGARPSKSAMLDELGMPAAEDDEDALLPMNKAQAAGPMPPADQLPEAGKMIANTPAKPNADDPASGASADPTIKPSKIDFSALAGFTFAKAAGMTEDEAMQLAAEAADQAIEDTMIAPVAQMLAQFEADGKTLAEFQTAFESMVGTLDDEALREVLDRAMAYSILRGAATGAA
jgi:phage gp29-like protein